MGKNIDDYIDRGLKGTPETKPSERREYLSQLRERIILALTNGQVLQPKPFKPIANLMKRHPSSRLYLDGDLDYMHLSKYIRIANENNIPFTIVDDKTSSTNIGLVLANPTAIDKEEIFVNQEEFKRSL
ncbi:YueI family protein [Sutcliffiella horikoshii]|uniref:YueI family protein n=1 Tax=Sutcliffiella horikoshii TaxID=79883 RepID=UPI00203B4F68|nr:YueI family protein [Sutcliffiella horikoshii]MCM3616459.1 YueI family protein [Sutcliffiella horikoshii]